jgi:hypothetical protein
MAIENQDTDISPRRKYLQGKSELFRCPPCIVQAWEHLIDEMIELIEEWNELEPNKLRFFMISEKHGSLVAYLEPENGDSCDYVPMHMRNAINSIANEGIKICTLCGNRKVQTIIEFKLRWRCLDHWESVT